MQTNHEIISDDRQMQLYYTVVRSYGEQLPAHWHEHLEILYILEGGMTACTGTDSRHLGPGDIFIVSPQDIHYTRSDDSCLYYMLQIPPAHLRRIGSDWQSLRFPVCLSARDAETPAALMQEINTLHERRRSREHLLLLGKVYELLYILSESAELPSDTAEAGRKQLERERIARCLDYVQEHYSEPVRLSDAAALLSVSEEHFCRLFKKHTGQTFLSYVTQIRMGHFYEDLIHTDQTIAFLLDRNGITNYKAFLKQFRLTYGGSPQQIRRRSSRAGLVL